MRRNLNTNDSRFWLNFIFPLLLILILIFGNNQQLCAQPVNDVCSGAINYPDFNPNPNVNCEANFINVNINMTNSTTETEQIPSCVEGDAYNSRWYLLEAPSSNMLITFPEGWEVGGLSIYQQGECGNLNQIFCTNNTETIPGSNYETSVSGLTVGEVYLVQFWTNDTTNNIVLKVCLKIGEPLSNDFCSGAYLFPDYNPNSCTFNTIDLTTTTNETEQIPSCAPEEAYNSRWFVWQAPSEVVDIEFSADNKIGGLAIYEQGECGNLNQIFCGSNNIDLDVNYINYATDLTVGDYYLLQFWSNDSNGNNLLDVCFSMGDPPLVNDACTGAIPFPGIITPPGQSDCEAIIIDNSGAKDEGTPISPDANCDVIGNYSQWFTFQPSLPVLKITSNGGVPGLAIFEGSCDSLVAISCYNANAQTQQYIYNLDTATTYFMTVWDDAPEQELNFCINSYETIQYLDCEEVEPFPGIITPAGNCAANMNTIESSELTENYSVSCQYFEYPGRAYSFVAPYENLRYIRGSGFPGIAVFEGDCGNFTEVACISGSDGYIEDLVVGETYILYVWAQGSNASNTGVSFCLRELAGITCEEGETLIEIIPAATNNWNVRDENNNVLASSIDEPLFCISDTVGCLTLYGSGISINGSSTENVYQILADGNLIVENATTGFQGFSFTFNCYEGEGCYTGEPVDMGSHVAPFAGYWYEFTPDETRTYTVNTCSVENDCHTSLYVYQECVFATGTAGMQPDSLFGAIASSTSGCEINDSLAQLQVALVEGENYYILIGDTDGQCADSSIQWEITKTPLSCSNNNGLLQIFTNTDNYPAETSWALTNLETGDTIGTATSNNFLGIQNSNVFEACVPASTCLDFTINDTFGDGICCDWGVGGYEIYFNGDLVLSGGQFEFSETVTFNCCDEENPPTWYEDNDGDGLGNNEVSITSCEYPEGYVIDNTDTCDDGIEDCTGTCNGTAFTDDCGNCLESTEDPNYNDCICESFTSSIELICPEEQGNSNYHLNVNYNGITEEGYVIMDNNTGSYAIINTGDTTIGPFDQNEGYSFTIYPVNNPQCAFIQTVEDISCEQTSINTLQSNLDLQLFPIPAKGFINIHFNANNGGSVSLKIHSVLGNLIEEKSLVCQQGTNDWSVDLSTYSNGAYFMTLIDNDKQYVVKRFVKQ